MAQRRRNGLAPSLGPAIVRWIEEHLCHGPGDLRGEEIVLDLELAMFIRKAYELDPKTGRRRVTRAFLSRPKGRAKSELAGMLVCAELLGPVRFDHWLDDGTPVGRPVRDPFIRCLATEEGQSTNTYANVVVMAEHLAEHHGGDLPQLDVGITRTFVAGGGEVRPSTAASASKDGGKETFAVADETHLWMSGELRAMHDTVTRNLTKRKTAQPWMLETSTMYAPGRGSVAEMTHSYAEEVAAGHLQDRGLLFDHRQGPMPADDDWDDDDVMMAALTEAYGAAAEWVDLDRILSEIRDPKTTRAAAVRYFLNRATADDDAWVTPAQWAPSARHGHVPADKAGIALGFDGSDTGDATALIGCSMADGHLFVLGIWEAPAGATEWRVPRDRVAATVEAAFKRWRVARMFADPPYWRTELSEWAARFGDKVVLEFPTSTWSRMARSVERFTSALHAGQLSHDGDDQLAQHVFNARRQHVNDRRADLGYVITKERPGSLLKIDAAVAAVLAFEARDHAIADGWKPRAAPRVVSLDEAWRKAQQEGPRMMPDLDPLDVADALALTDEERHDRITTQMAEWLDTGLINADHVQPWRALVKADILSRSLRRDLEQGLQ